MVPNPPIVMASVDCDEYVHYLTLKAFDKVAEHLLIGVRKLAAARCNLLVIASNTGHIAVPAIEKEFPGLRILHIADCFAHRLRQQGISNVGLLGTKPTMEEDYLKSRLSLHGITTVVPEEEELQEEIYEIICQELSLNVLKDDSRAKMVESILGLKARGAEACILGCTEIELLVKQEHVPDLALFPSAEIQHRDGGQRPVTKSSLGRRAPVSASGHSSTTSPDASVTISAKPFPRSNALP